MIIRRLPQLERVSLSSRLAIAASRSFQVRSSYASFIYCGVLSLLALVAFGSLSPSARAQRLVLSLSLTNDNLEVTAVAVNPATNLIYAATRNPSTLTAGPTYVIDGNDHNGAINIQNVIIAINDTSGNANDPYAIAIDPQRNRVYVANRGGAHGSITVIDGATNTYVENVSDTTAAAPSALAVDVAHNTLYSGNQASISAINFNSITPAITHLATTSNVTSLAINPATNLLYAAVNGTGVAVYSLPGFTLQNTVTDAAGSTVVAVDSTPAGFAYAAGTGSVHAISGTGSTPGSVVSISDPNSPANSQSVAVNPNTHRAYVSSLGGSASCATGCVSIYLGSAYQGTVSTTGAANSVAVDTATDIAFAPQANGVVTVVRGSDSSKLPDLTLTGNNKVIAVNPVTHRAYVGVFNASSPYLGIIDGNSYSADDASPISLPSNPYSIAVNPATNQIYVTDFNDNEVSIIDGSSNSVTSLSTGERPTAAALDPFRNLLYVANSGASSITVVDGNTSSVANTIVFGDSTPPTPDTLAVNPIVNQVYGGSSTTGTIFQFNGGTGTGFASSFAPAFGGTLPVAAATNPASGMAYQLIHSAGNDPGFGNPPFLTVEDPAAPRGFYIRVCIFPTQSDPVAMDVNTATNSVFVICSDGGINVVTGASGFTDGHTTFIPASPNFGTSGRLTSVAVNSLTNVAYVADYGNSKVYVINGNNNTIVQELPVGAFPVSIAVNQVSNKIYVLGAGSSDPAIPPTLSIIDGFTSNVLTKFLDASNTPSNVNVPAPTPTGIVYPEIAANPATGEIYALAGSADRAYVFDENVPVTTCPTNCLKTTIARGAHFTNADAPNTTYTTAPGFVFTTQNTFSNAPVNAVFYQLDTQQGPWLPATAAPAAGTFTGSFANVAPGFHTVYAFATDAEDANSSSFSGLQASPFVGAIASYSFLVAPPNSNAGPAQIFFANTSVGSTSNEFDALIANEGGADLNFSYTITGPNAADFIVIPASFNPCPTSGTISPVNQGTAYCAVGLHFRPSTEAAETATLTFTSNSLQTVDNGPNNFVQTITLNGTGNMAIPTFTEVPGNPSYLTSGFIDFQGQPGDTFMCSLRPQSDPPSYTPCTSPYSYSELSENSTYSFYVTRTAGSNTSEPAVITWTVVPSQVTVTLAGNGTGTVTSSPAGINCNPTCVANFNGVPVTLTATPTAGSTFAGWSNVTPDINNSCSGTGTCTLQTGDSFQAATATFTAPLGNVQLTIVEKGTGTGQVSDDVHPACSESGGTSSGTCTYTYPANTSITLTESTGTGSTFTGWPAPCPDPAGPTCSFTITSNTTITVDFLPPAQEQPISFPATTNSTGMATFDCPSNPNPTPENPCLDPNAHAIAFTVPQVTTPFTLTVRSVEVPPDVANGLCPAGDSPTQDFDCRFKSFFTYQTQTNGDTVVPLCYPYANGNCVLYQIFLKDHPGQEPDPSSYTGPVDWLVTLNNDTFVPPVPYLGSTPRLYEDPDGFVLPNSPYGTDCNSPMLVGNPGTPTNPPIFCQFVFDITTFFDPNKKVDAGIGGKTKVFSDAIVAIPPATQGFVTVTSTPDAATVPAGSPIGFTIAIVNGSTATANNATLNDPLPSGTNINWAISPAYSGPGTCAISGAVGSQVLNCSFGNVAVSASFSLHLLSASSSAGNYINQSFVTASNQQVLSVVNITVNPVPIPSFSNLTPSQTITYGAASVTLAGKVASGVTVPASGEHVTITINGVDQQAAIGSNGAFSTTFPTATIPASTTPYPIKYAYAGDANLGAATDQTTTLTINKASQTISFTTAPPASAPYGSTFAVAATATSGLPVAYTSSGACTVLTGSTYKMTAATGTCSVIVNQAGNANYLAAPQKTQGVTATKAASTTIITSNSPNPSNVGQAVAVGFKVTGAGNPTGSVTVTATLGTTHITCSGTLTVSTGAGSCSVTLNTAGAWTLTATYAGDTNFNPSSTSLGTAQTVNSALSTLRFSPAALNFGVTYPGSIVLRTLTITNAGPAMVTFNNFSVGAISGDDSTGFLGIEFCPHTLNAGKSCTLIMSFTANSNVTKTHAANLVISDTAVGSPHSIPMTVTVINPIASFSPSSLSFGNQKSGTTSAAKSVVLRNTGTTPLALSGLSISGNFAFATGTTCTSSTTLAPNGTCNLNVVFKPTSKGSKTGNIVVSDNARNSPQSVSLSGTGN